jgi:hypothetical protein
MRDLPKVFRQFRLAELGGLNFKPISRSSRSSWKQEDPEVNMSQTDILGYLSRMRHITGIAKVDAAVEFSRVLARSERKIVVFLHHKQAAAILMAKLSKLCQEAAMCPPCFTGGLDERRICYNRGV